jgi:hypothetical protein
VKSSFGASRVALWAWLLGLVPASQAAPPSSFPTEEAAPRQFGSVTVGLSGGFQMWTLTGLEELIEDRAADFAQDGFELSSDTFEVTFSYGLELQLRLTRAWFLRGQFEWARLQVEDRDRKFLSPLGGRDRTPVSLSYQTRVRTAPVFLTIGPGRSVELESVRFGFSGGVVIAPVRVEDVLSVHMQSTTKSKVLSTGIGYGLEGTASVDYFTDVRTTLFLELFYRYGATPVSLQDGYWESTNLPGERRVDFSGGGIRLGLRWI